MKKAIPSILGLLVTTVGLWATVPYTFTPNTPAKASEVNSNFQSLSDKITTLEGNVSNISTSIQGNSADCNKNVFPYTYQYTPSDIGDIVTVRGVEYIIVALPFIEHATGDHYYIKKPVKKPTSNVSLFVSISTSYVQQGTECYTESFLGFPASANTSIRYSIGYSGRLSDPASSYDAFSITHNVGYNRTIKINQTILAISMGLNEILQTPIITSDADFTDDINWSAPVIDNSIVDDLKTLFNYIEIVKIP